MKSCSSSIALASSAIVANVWLLRDCDGQRFLIDTGVRTERMALDASLRRAGIRNRGDLNAIFLTHRHCDHAGNAAWLRERFGCPIYCHAEDAQILSGQAAREPLRRGIGSVYDELCCGIEDLTAVRLDVDDAFALGAWKHGFEGFAAFGHTEGSVLLYHRATATLFTGDALLSGVPPLRTHERFSLAIPAYSLDVDQCHDHVRSFLRDHPKVQQLCAGHGPFVGDDVEQKLAAFARSIERVQKPTRAIAGIWGAATWHSGINAVQARLERATETVAETAPQVRAAIERSRALANGLSSRR